MKQPISLTLVKAEELANTTSCPSTKGSTEAQLFLNSITSGQTGRSTQAQSECWFKLERVREVGTYHGVVEIMACRKRVKSKWEMIIIASGCWDRMKKAERWAILVNLSIRHLIFFPTQKGRDIIFPSRPIAAILFSS